jgi:hypothetical protein
MTFEVWDRASGNLLGEFAEASDAYRLVGEILEDEGVEGVKSLALLVEDDRGHTKRVASGQQLVSLAHGATAAGAV